MSKSDHVECFPRLDLVVTENTGKVSRGCGLSLLNRLGLYLWGNSVYLQYTFNVSLWKFRVWLVWPTWVSHRACLSVCPVFLMCTWERDRYFCPIQSITPSLCCVLCAKQMFKSPLYSFPGRRARFWISEVTGTRKKEERRCESERDSS